MNVKKVLKVAAIIATVAILSSVLTSCGGKDDATDTEDTSTGDTQQTSDTSDSQPTVDFELQQTADPNFDAIEQGQSVDTSDGLYTLIDGYAYALDAETLEPTGPALDPITKEPIETQPAEETPTEEVGTTAETEQPADDAIVPEQPVVNEQPAEEQPIEPTAETEVVSEEVRLPNTGIFLEDD